MKSMKNCKVSKCGVTEKCWKHDGSDYKRMYFEKSWGKRQLWYICKLFIDLRKVILYWNESVTIADVCIPFNLYSALTAIIILAYK